jgi:type II secretory pathway pseudopilin PulG
VLIELVVVFGMLAVLTTMTMSSLFGSHRTATVTATVDTLIADLRSQQTKAMSGSQQSGISPAGYGIYFQTNQYTLFKGTTYSAGDTSNAVIALDPRVTFSAISLPGSTIAFASKSGEFVNYATSSSSLVVRHSDSGNAKTIRLNRYGVITSVN